MTGILDPSKFGYDCPHAYVIGNASDAFRSISAQMMIVSGNSV